MADRPILFSGPMVQALLDGRKTQTRRVMKLPGEPRVYLGMNGNGDHVFPAEGLWGGQWRSPYRVGDRLYVREAWRTASHLDRFAPKVLPVDSPVFFEADATGEPNGATGKFRQGMHMPRWASRLTLIVTDVRVQRLQEISEEDAKAEGVHPAHEPNERLWEHYVPHGVAYRNLWDSLNADRGYGWDANPWVVALTFTVHRCNIDQMPRAA